MERLGQTFYFTIDDVDVFALRMQGKAWHAEDIA